MKQFHKNLPIFLLGIAAFGALAIYAMQSQGANAQEDYINLEWYSDQEVATNKELQETVSEERRLRVERKKLEDYCMNNNQIITEQLVELYNKREELMYTWMSHVGKQ